MANITDVSRLANVSKATVSRVLSGSRGVREESRLAVLQAAEQLNFRRERLDSTRGRTAPCPAGTILSHRALLRLQDGTPLALVVECYTRANLRG